MTLIEAKKVLLKTAAIWPRQPTDAATAAAWSECLTRVTLSAALEALALLRDSGAHDAPTCGEVYRAAAELEHRQAEGRRTRLYLEHQPSEAERAEYKRTLREMVERLGRRLASG